MKIFPENKTVSQISTSQLNAKKYANWKSQIVISISDMMGLKRSPYAFVANLIKKAKKEIILIDNYIDESVLNLLSKRQKDVTAILYTKSISKALQLDLDKHHSQYPEIQVKTFAQSHDRFLLIDQVNLYHIGASLKNLGKKPVVSEVESWFAFSRMDSMTALLLNQLKNLK